MSGGGSSSPFLEAPPPKDCSSNSPRNPTFPSSLGENFIFWVDERHVPLTHETSNYRMTQEYLLSKVPIPKENIFPATNGILPVEKAASAYEIKMGKFFGTENFPRFDLVLLGMGDDGHTASLFPGVPQVNEQEKWVVGYFVDDARKERVSLTFPVLNAARLQLVLVEGAKKAERLKDVLEGPKDPPSYPSNTCALPMAGWFSPWTRLRLLCSKKNS